MAIVDLGLLGTGSSKTAATTLAVTNTTGAAIAAGTLIHITGTWDNINSVTAPTITCSTVGGGTATANHATAIGSGVTTTAGSGVWHQCFRVLTTSSIASGATIATLTSNQSAVARAAHAEGWTGVTTTLRGTVTTATSISGAPSVASTGTALVARDLVIGSVSSEDTALMTGAPSTFNGTWDAIVGTFTTGSTATTNAATGTQDKVVTATGAQTFAPTGPSSMDAVACIYSLVPDPAPTITQAAYRLYADGTETGATALAAENTSYTADVSGGDVNLLVRLRLQSTNTSAVPATDDFRLQWEKNASGAWTYVDASPTLADGYDESNFTTIFQVLGNATIDVVGQSFIGNGSPLTRAGFYLAKLGSPTVSVEARIYGHTGTFGSTGLGTGSPLATSTTSVAATTLGTTHAWQYFDFDGTFTPSAGTSYVVAVVATGTLGDNSNRVHVATDNSVPTHPGNASRINTGSWQLQASEDLIFKVFTTADIAVPYNSANLTDGAATTARLTAGTGTFVAGKVSEDGLADNLGWSGNNYTELLYTVTLKQVGLVNGDTVRFRVIDSNTEPVFTYTQVPTIPVTAGAVAFPYQPLPVQILPAYAVQRVTSR